jgi:hypothetical protein
MLHPSRAPFAARGRSESVETNMHERSFLVRDAFITLLRAGALAAALAFAGQAYSQDGGSAEMPRTAGGHPDLSGIWQTLNTAVWDLEAHSPSLGVPAGESVVEGGEIPYQPSALEQRQKNYMNRHTQDPEANCYVVGVPRTVYMPYPFQIVQTPTQITMLSEYVHSVRDIHMNSDHPPPGIEWWMGDSRGHWEGDTLVVDVTEFNDRTWFDRSGNFHSKDLHVVERYTPSGPDHILYEATIEDPKVFTRPWKISMPLYRRKDKNMRLLEYECQAYLEEKKAGVTEN